MKYYARRLTALCDHNGKIATFKIEKFNKNLPVQNINLRTLQSYFIWENFLGKK